MIVRIEAKAERPRHIHWATGGTSGTIENIKKVKLVADPKSGDCPDAFIYSNPLIYSQAEIFDLEKDCQSYYDNIIFQPNQYLCLFRFL